MNRCAGCNRENPEKDRVCIPPPDEPVRGCLISRDPTSAFLVPLHYYQQCSFPNRGLFCLDAPPRWLYNKIRGFLSVDEISEEKMERLYHFLDRECYWTHLHKCPTCKKPKNPKGNQPGISGDDDRFQPFRYSTAKSCADKWFAPEFARHHLENKIIITCGRDVQKFFNEWAENKFPGDSLQVINLPHPSGANCGSEWSWNRNCRQNESIGQEIGRLLDFI
jgi:hypothetical protein